MSIGDIDIDVKSSTNKDSFGVRAIIVDSKNKKIIPHPSGYYIDDNIPIDYITGMSTVGYKDMEDRGFFKVDLLTNTSYDNFNSKQEVLDALDTEPDWTLLSNKKFVSTLPHLATNFELLQLIQPHSIIELSDFLALIRPAKIKFIDDYIENKDRVRKNLYKKPKSGYYIKKSHAVAYAHMIVCVMNNKNKAKDIIQYGGGY